MPVSSGSRQSPAHVTGDSAPVQGDSPPVTLGNAGSYDSFPATPGLMAHRAGIQEAEKVELAPGDSCKAHRTGGNSQPPLPRCPGDKDRETAI